MTKKDYENTKAFRTKDGYVGSHFSGHAPSGNSKWVKHLDKKFKTEHEARKYAMKFQKESIEPINELSKRVLKDYAKKAHKNSLDSMSINKVLDRISGEGQAEDRLKGKFRVRNDNGTTKRIKYHAESELNELSPQTLTSYKDKASKKKLDANRIGGLISAKQRLNGKIQLNMPGRSDKSASFKRYTMEDTEQVDEKVAKPKKYKYVSGFKPSNSGVALKKNAIDPKKQAGTYAKWKAKKDSEGKAAADAWLQKNEGFESIEQWKAEMTKLNENETNTTTENPFEVARAHYDTLIQGALSGNAVDVRNSVNDIMVTKASEVVAAIKDEVAQTMFGTDDGKPKVDDDDDEWSPEDEDDLEDDDDDTEHPELDDDDEDDENFEDDDEEVEDDDNTEDDEEEDKDA